MSASCAKIRRSASNCDGSRAIASTLGRRTRSRNSSARIRSAAGNGWRSRSVFTAASGGAM
jgi:hypothetical protein